MVTGAELEPVTVMLPETETVKAAAAVPPITVRRTHNLTVVELPSVKLTSGRAKLKLTKGSLACAVLSLGVLAESQNAQAHQKRDSGKLRDRRRREGVTERALRFAGGVAQGWQPLVGAGKG